MKAWFRPCPRKNPPNSTIRIIFLFPAILAAGQFFMQTTQAIASTDSREDERAIISIEHKVDQAYLTGDADYLDSILSSDFILTNVRGEVSKKAEEVAEVRNGIIHYDKFQTSDLNVRVYGDTAVATGQTWIKGIVKKNGRI